jgi:hypothetical protein
MTRDPIVAEVHRARDELLKECEGDMETLGKRLKANETAHADRLGSPKERRGKDSPRSEASEG